MYFVILVIDIHEVSECHSSLQMFRRDSGMVF